MTDQSRKPAPPGVARALADLWDERLRRPSSAARGDELQRLARRVGHEARHAALLPEHLVILVKESWAAHPRVHDARDRTDVQWALRETVSLCIEEFFRAAPTTPSRSISPSP